MMNTKNFFTGVFALMFFFLSFSVSNSQSLPDSLKPKNSLEKGAWAVQFGIGKNFTLTNFSGASFTIKRHFSKNVALRFGVGTTLSDLNGSYFDTNSVIAQNDINRTYFNFNLLVLYYLNPSKDFNVYLSAGPTFGYGFEKFSATSGANYVNQTYKQNSFGGEAGFGAEYFIAKSFSVFGEYSITLTDKKDNVYTNGPGFDLSTEQSSTEFYFNNVRFGASVYF